MTDHINIEFRRTVLPDEVEALCHFDRKVFGSYPDDLFSPEDWAELESYWVITDGITVGCVALKRDVDYDEEPKPGSLYIESTGLLPKYQRQGYGAKIKEWQIDYAKKHGFKVIVTNARESNIASVRLNQRFGFTICDTVPDYYSNPDESATVMEAPDRNYLAPRGRQSEKSIFPLSARQLQRLVDTGG
jgi:ribosomal protein S18 acetylase RimI-like enzyme